METIKIHLDKVYEDTADHYLFAAKYYLYEEVIDDPTWEVTSDTRGLPIPKIPNPQTPWDYMQEKAMEVIESFMTAPVKAYVITEGTKQAEQQAEQMAQVVLANLK
jgi:hypothetical protein